MSVDRVEILLVQQDTVAVGLTPLQTEPFRIQWMRDGSPYISTAVPWVGRHGESMVCVMQFGAQRIVVLTSPQATYLSSLTSSMSGSAHAASTAVVSMPTCSTDDVLPTELPRWRSIAMRKHEADAVQTTFTVPLSIDLDWQGRQQFSSVEEATAYCTGIFAEMKTQFATIPGADLVLANLRVWDTENDPFPDAPVPNAFLFAHLRSVWAQSFMMNLPVHLGQFTPCGQTARISW